MLESTSISGYIKHMWNIKTSTYNLWDNWHSINTYRGSWLFGIPISHVVLPSLGVWLAVEEFPVEKSEMLLFPYHSLCRETHLSVLYWNARNHLGLFLKPFQKYYDLRRIKGLSKFTITHQLKINLKKKKKKSFKESILTHYNTPFEN